MIGFGRDAVEHGELGFEARDSHASRTRILFVENDLLPVKDFTVVAMEADHNVVLAHGHGLLVQVVSEVAHCGVVVDDRRGVPGAAPLSNSTPRARRWVAGL